MVVRSQVTDRLIEVLHATIAEVEQTSGVPCDDPSLGALKQILLLRIADLEAERAADSAASKPPAVDAPAPDKLDPPALPATEIAD